MPLVGQARGLLNDVVARAMSHQLPNEGGLRLNTEAVTVCVKKTRVSDLDILKHGVRAPVHSRIHAPTHDMHANMQARHGRSVCHGMSCVPTHIMHGISWASSLQQRLDRTIMPCRPNWYIRLSCLQNCFSCVGIVPHNLMKVE